MYLLCCKGWSLRYLPGQGNPHHCIMVLCVGSKRDNEDCSALSQLSVTSPTTHKQIGPFWCWFPGGWACVHSMTLWVSPMNSPLSLWVSLTAATPLQVFIARGFEALFPCAGTLGCMVRLTPQLFLPIYQDANVGPPSLPDSACYVSSLPWLPISIPPPVWMNVSSLTPWLSDFQFDFLSVVVIFCF